MTQCEFWDLPLFSNADIPAIAHPYICADLATCVWIQQAQFFPFYQLSVIGDRLRYPGRQGYSTITATTAVNTATVTVAKAIFYVLCEGCTG
ncbi:hypothetical protein [Nostoc sp.]|uniref:hypothetical protein n=1 Tax=Nostoc sp. TaxID=1180 RepID=UPI002FF46A72